MTTTGKRWMRRTTVIAVAGITATTGTALALAAPSKGSPGSGFGSVNISASAAAVRAPFYSSGGEDVSGSLPYARTSLDSGLDGHALTTVFWPGDTGGAGGSTLYTATSGCIPPSVDPLSFPCSYQLPPSAFQPLNDPMKAEAQSGTNPTDSNSHGGVTQEAVAKPSLVSATSSVGAAKVPQVSEAFGTLNASSKIQVTGPKTAVVSASSAVTDIKLAKGLISIASVKSVAQATSNTVKGTGKAATTVSGASIAGVPVTIDSSGVHIKGGKGINPALDKTVNKALQQSGIQIFVAKPTTTIHRAAVTVDSGDLIVLFGQSQYVQNANDTGTLLILGGASITANTGKGFTTPKIAPVKVPGTTANQSGGSGPVSSGGGSSGGSVGGGSVSVPGADTTTGSTGQAPAVAPQSSPQLAASSNPLLSSYGIIWAVLGAIVAAGLAFGLRRLPDRVFATPTVVCPLED